MTDSNGGSVPDDLQHYMEATAKWKKRAEDAERMLAAIVWAHPSKSVTLFPIHLTTPLELHRQDDAIGKSVRFFAERTR